MQRLLSLLFLLVFTSQASQAQQQHPFSLGVELSTKHVWRGIEFGTAPVIFPQINFQKKGWTAYLLGGYALNGSHGEVDMTLSYAHQDWCVGVNNYYFVSPSGEKDKYFHLRGRTTGHYLEGFAQYTLPFLPLTLYASTYFTGPDKLDSGKQAYSSYAELCYTHRFNPTDQLSFTAGASLNRGFYTNYEHAFSVVNLTLKYATTLKLGKFELPAAASFILNPATEKSHISLSLYWNSL